MQIEELNHTNCKSYLLVLGTSAILVDPVRDRFDTYFHVLKERDLQLQMILETHTHADHLMFNRVAKIAFSVPIVMHRESPSPLVDVHVSDGERIPFAGEFIEVIHTPGHTPDAVCYRVPGAVFTGDTLLIGGSGRTDFPGGDAAKQYAAVTERLFTLPDETLVFPAHDYQGKTSSTIGEEKRTNPRFIGKTLEQYVALMGNLGLPFPERVQQALQVNQSGFEEVEVGFPQVREVAAMEQLSPSELHTRMKRELPPILLDVREPEEFVGELGHIEGSLLVPMDALAHRLPKLVGYLDREVVVVCRAGARSASAGAILRAAGFKRVFNLEGGMLRWVDCKLPSQR
ncbi:MAG: MBL fold metallo-hydrolase [Polyangiales bacterium]